MKTVRVELGARAYDVRIGPSLLSDAAAQIAPLLARPKVAGGTGSYFSTSADWP